jgi:hypothetical protein
MADQLMTVVQSVKAGILDVVGNASIKAGNAAGGDYFYFPNDGHTVLVIDATSGDTFTFTAVNDPYGRTETLAPVVASGKVAVLGPLMPELWNVTSGTYAGCAKFKPSTGHADDYLLAVRVTNPT